VSFSLMKVRLSRMILHSVVSVSVASDRVSHYRCARRLGCGLGTVSGNSSTGGWFGILGGTHEKDCVFIHVTVNK